MTDMKKRKYQARTLVVPPLQMVLLTQDPGQQSTTSAADRQPTEQERRAMQRTVIRIIRHFETEDR